MNSTVKWLEAKHASAPEGHKCADCSIEPCAECYAVWWKSRHANTVNVTSWPNEDMKLALRLLHVYYAWAIAGGDEEAAGCEDVLYPLNRVYQRREERGLPLKCEIVELLKRYPYSTVKPP